MVGTTSMIEKDEFGGTRPLSVVPFRHFRVDNFISKSIQLILLDWFEGSAPWKPHVKEDFYNLEDFDVHKANLPDKVEFVRSSETIHLLRDVVGQSFGVDLADKVDIQAHKLEYSQLIKVHTDFGSRGQTHRLVIHVNRGWTFESGGILMLLDCERPSDVTPNQRFIVPRSGSAVGFEISAQSFHAVSTVFHGVRYTLQYSFRKKLEGNISS